MWPAAVQGRSEAWRMTQELHKMALMPKPCYWEAVASAEKGEITHTSANELAKAETHNGVFPNLIFTYTKGHSPSL